MRRSNCLSKSAIICMEYIFFQKKNLHGIDMHLVGGSCELRPAGGRADRTGGRAYHTKSLAAVTWNLTLRECDPARRLPENSLVGAHVSAAKSVARDAGADGFTASQPARETPAKNLSRLASASPSSGRPSHVRPRASKR